MKSAGFAVWCMVSKVRCSASMPRVAIASLVLLLAPLLRVPDASAFTNASLKGSYVCLLSGGFEDADASFENIEISFDGKGNVLNPSSPGKLNLEAGTMNVGVGHRGAVASSSTVTNSVEHGVESCEYTVNTGTYEVKQGSGGGQMTVKWAAGPSNPTSPYDCSENITADYAFQLISASSLNLVASDNYDVSTCTAESLNFANCGEYLWGTCTKQTGETFP